MNNALEHFKKYIQILENSRTCKSSPNVLEITFIVFSNSGFAYGSPTNMTSPYNDYGVNEVDCASRQNS